MKCGYCVIDLHRLNIFFLEISGIAFKIIIVHAPIFFDDTVIIGKFCVGVPLNIQSIYLPYNCKATNLFFPTKIQFVKANDYRKNSKSPKFQVS